MEGTEQRHLGRILTLILSGVAIATSLFYIYTGWFGAIGFFRQRAPILIVCMVLIFLTIPLFKKHHGRWIFIVDGLLAVLSIVIFVYLWQYDLVTFDKLIAGPSTFDLFLGGILLLMVLEATRRVIGWPLVIVTIAFILYARFGNYFPGILYHPGFSWVQIIDFVSLYGDGLFGVPLSVASTVIVVFIIFSSFLQASGGSWFFIEFPNALFGRVRGGPAKVAVVASGLVGTVTGSVVANVTTTGTFTIPMMKRLGYKPAMAAAIETAASSGGQIMPPVMGTAAFIMADLLGVPYWSVCVAAFLPAILYYIGLFMAVDLQAVKGGIKGLPKSELPPVRKTLARGWFLLIPLIVLIYFLGVAKLTPATAAIYAIVSTVVVSMFSKTTRMGIKKILLALENGTKGMTMVTAACGVAGIVLAIVALTGLGINLSSMLVDIAGNNLVVLLLLTAAASIILGFGVTTTVAYLVLALLVGPALVKMGVPILAAHLFIFYYGTLSQLTPPSAIGAYAAAAIAGAPPMRTAFISMKIGAIAFILPFFFVFNPQLILQGAPGEIVLAAITAVIGEAAFVFMLEGYMIRKTSIMERILFGIAGLLLIWPGLLTDAFGCGLLVVAVIMQLIGRRREQKVKTDVREAVA